MSERAARLNQLILDYIGAISAEKVKEVLKKPGVNESHPSVIEIRDNHTQYSWLQRAANNALQLKVVTHIAKGIHSAAKGSDVDSRPYISSSRELVGTHSLAVIAEEISGPAAALGAYKFLIQEFEGKTLLQLLREGDADAQRALSDDPKLAESLRDAFLSIYIPRPDVSIDHLGKSIFWPVPQAGESHDPMDNSQYHVLASIYASSLSYEIFLRISEHRFGEAAKEARAARREMRTHPTGFCEYPDLAIEEKGGSNAQNVSYLNAKRTGINYRLASLPPNQLNIPQADPESLDTVFRDSCKTREVRTALNALRDYSSSDDSEAGRGKKKLSGSDKAQLLQVIFDGLMQHTATLRSQLKTGWSRDPDLEWPSEERYWLDPLRAATEPSFLNAIAKQDWAFLIAEGFAAHVAKAANWPAILHMQSLIAEWTAEIHFDCCAIVEEAGINMREVDNAV